MLSLILNKKIILPLLLMTTAFIYSPGFASIAHEEATQYHERAIPYTIQKKANNTKLISEEKSLLLQISSDHNTLLLVSLVFTVFCSLLVYFLIQSKHKRERFMEGYITETRIAKKIHDEIANEIYGTMNYLTSEKEIPDKVKENLMARLDDIYFMTKNISRETNSIDTGYNFPEHLKMMLTAYSGNAINVIIKGIDDINWNAVHAMKKIATYRSLQELMVNMKKHSQATLVIIDFYLSKKKLEITYTDNGRGATKEQLLLKNGLSNVENRMTSIDGQSNFDVISGKGFHVVLTYPAYSSYAYKNFNYRRHR